MHPRHPCSEAPSGGSFRNASRFRLLAVVFGAGILTTQALAQQSAPLRGPGEENVLHAQSNGPRRILAQNASPPDAGIPSQPYEPASPGALPPETDNGSPNLRGLLPENDALP